MPDAFGGYGHSGRLGQRAAWTKIAASDDAEDARQRSVNYDGRSNGTSDARIDLARRSGRPQALEEEIQRLLRDVTA